MNLKAEDNVAGWTVAQWITALSDRGGIPMPTNHIEAMNFRLKYLQTHAEPAPYDGSDIETELIEVAILLDWHK